MHRGPRLSEPCTLNHAIVRGTEYRKIVNNHCQDANYVLVWFGIKAGEGRKAYGKFVDEGVDQERRPDLVGGWLVRSMGGWSVVKAMRRSGVREKCDERMLGSGRFVEQLMEEAIQEIKHQTPTDELVDHAEKEIRAVCKRENIRVSALRSASPRRAVSRLRAQFAMNLVQELGLSLEETALQLGLSTSAIAQILRRNQ